MSILEMIFYSVASMTPLYPPGMETMNSMAATVMMYYKVGWEQITLIVAKALIKLWTLVHSKGYQSKKLWRLVTLVLATSTVA
jgi:hypothetical protein